MTNENINYPVGTVFKEIYEGKPYYYIVGDYYIYCNSWDSLHIRPWKFNVNECTIASEDEKKEFIEALKKNHLIWDEETGKVEREFEEITLNVKVKVRPGTSIDKVLETLNFEKNSKPYDIWDWKFENC